MAKKKTAGRWTKAGSETEAADAAEPEVETAESGLSRGGGRNLLIVESPAKAKTINKFLGRSFSVKASMGHVRDIPSRGTGRKAFGIDIENGYAPTYEPIKGREKVLKELAAAAEKADFIYLAPDPDREGEAIAWHIKEALHLPSARTRRVTFNSITKRAVQEAIANPTDIDMNLVNAQQGRRVLDRLVGYSLSPFLWKKITKGLSAGRVQSVAVRIVVEREREIRAFKPEEFWRITAVLSLKEQEAARFSALLVEWRGEKFALGSAVASTGQSAEAVAEALRAAEYKVLDVSEKEVRSNPPPPFITSTLQQAASTQLRFGAAKTMRVAQGLYEGVEIEGGQSMGLITYMRTDSFNIAPEALQEVRDHIRDNYDARYLPEKPNAYRSRQNAQEAHEAIRPTSVFLTPERVQPFLNSDQYRLYDLIWRRFVASQMTAAVYQTTTARIGAAEGILEAKGRRVLFEGWTSLGNQAEAAKKRQKAAKEKDDAAPEEEERDDQQILPALAGGDPLRLWELTPSQHFTQPPPRYTEASLVRALEKEGIGRPSTYAPIVQTIQERGYVRLDNRRFHATELGMAVTDMLMANFASIMDLKFTAGMEEDLDRVEEGQVDWVELIDRFYRPFIGQLETAGKEAQPLKGQPAPNGETCPECAKQGVESPMVIRYSKGGAFLGCSKYPECKQTVPLDREGKPLLAPEEHRKCDQCGGLMNLKSSRRGRYLACANPQCGALKSLAQDGTATAVPKIEGVICDKCGAPMVVRMSGRGPFLACKAFPKCRNSKPMPGEEPRAPAKGKGKSKTEAETEEI